jgi:hypothetical protein
MTLTDVLDAVEAGTFVKDESPQADDIPARRRRSPLPPDKTRPTACGGPLSMPITIDQMTATIR